MSTRYLKAPNPPTTQATDELRARVSEILRDIEQGGIDAVRRYSLEFDGWAPDDFVVSDAEYARVAAELDDTLKGHIAFAQDQVRGFAQAQLATLTPLEVEMGPGVVLGHRHIPVDAVGAYVPGGRYPMLASSFMTVLVAKVAGVEQVVGCAPPQRDGGIHPAMLYAMKTSGADAILAPRRRPGPGGDGVRAHRWPGARRHARRGRQRVRRRGQAPAVRPRRDRPAGRPDRDPRDRR